MGTCSNDPKAVHGFDRNASHNAGEYICTCEGESYCNAPSGSDPEFDSSETEYLEAKSNVIEELK